MKSLLTTYDNSDDDVGGRFSITHRRPGERGGLWVRWLLLFADALGAWKYCELGELGAVRG